MLKTTSTWLANMVKPLRLFQPGPKSCTFPTQRYWTTNDTASSARSWPLSKFSHCTLKMPLPQKTGSNFKNKTSTFQSGGVGTFWLFGVLWIFTIVYVGCLQVVLFREKRKQRRLHERISFLFFFLPLFFFLSYLLLKKETWGMERRRWYRKFRIKR